KKVIAMVVARTLDGTRPPAKLRVLVGGNSSHVHLGRGSPPCVDVGCNFRGLIDEPLQKSCQTAQRIRANLEVVNESLNLVQHGSAHQGHPTLLFRPMQTARDIEQHARRVAKTAKNTRL